MGSTQAMDMAGAVDEGLISLWEALAWHLATNHYPPLAPEWLDAAEQAVEMTSDDMPIDTQIETPIGPRDIEGIIINLHLEAFIKKEDDGEIGE